MTTAYNWTDEAIRRAGNQYREDVEQAKDDQMLSDRLSELADEHYERADRARHRAANLRERMEADGVWAS